MIAGRCPFLTAQDRCHSQQGAFEIKHHHDLIPTKGCLLFVLVDHGLLFGRERSRLTMVVIEIGTLGLYLDPQWPHPPRNENPAATVEIPLRLTIQ